MYVIQNNLNLGVEIQNYHFINLFIKYFILFYILIKFQIDRSLHIFGHFTGLSALLGHQQHRVKRLFSESFGLHVGLVHFGWKSKHGVANSFHLARVVEFFFKQVQLYLSSNCNVCIWFVVPDFAIPSFNKNEFLYKYLCGFFCFCLHSYWNSISKLPSPIVQIALKYFSQKHRVKSGIH